MNISTIMRSKHTGIGMVVIVFVILTGVVFIFGQQQSTIKNSTAIQFLLPDNHAIMSTGTLTISVGFYPATATVGYWPVARAWRLLVEEVVVTGDFVQNTVRTSIFDEITSVTESNTPFTINREVQITSYETHAITAYLLTYDSYIDYLSSGEDPAPTLYPDDHVPYSILSPSGGESVCYNDISIFVEAGETPAEEVVPTTTTSEKETDSAIVSGFELSFILLSLVAINHIKKRKTKDD